VESLEPATAEKLLSFVENGGRIFCVETYPDKSLGWNNYQQKDQQVKAAVEKMKMSPDRFILLKKPEKEFIHWYKDVQEKYSITPYVRIGEPDRFLTQVRYQATGMEILFITTSSLDDSHLIQLVPSEQIARDNYAWIWEAETGKRYKLKDSKNISLDLGPAASILVVFDRNKKGESWQPKTQVTPTGSNTLGPWKVQFKHLDGSTQTSEMEGLKDLKDLPQFVSFSGTVIYRTLFHLLRKNQALYLDLGKLYGISEVILNGRNLGVQWYGRRIYSLQGAAQDGENTLEIRVVTTMGNYMKTLKDNPIAQYWTNEKRKDQAIQSMGLVGPVTVGTLNSNNHV
jgi:hypothetical protein